MNRVLIGLGLLAAVIGVTLLLWPSTQQTEVMRDRSQVPTPAVPAPADAGGSGLARAILAEPLPADLTGLDFKAAQGRVTDLLPRSGASGDAAEPAAPTPATSLRLPTFPRRGQAEILIRSTLGGLEQGACLSPSWELVAPDLVCLTLPELKAEARLAGGRWSLSPATAPKTLLELARFVAGLDVAFAAGAELRIAEPLRLFGQAWTPVALGPEHALCRAQAEPAKPTEEGSLASDLLLLVLDGRGRFAGVERLQADPSTPAEPGSLVKRLRLEFPDPSPALPR